MNKKHIDIKGIQKLANDIAKKEGEGSIFSLSGKSGELNLPRWSTGLPDLDNILGGGMPEGRMIEIYGAESSGKTTLGYHLCARHPICLEIPIEGTFDGKRAKLFGNRPKQMLVYNRAKYGEQVMNKSIQFSEKGIPLIMIDSVPYMQRKQDVDKILKAAHKDEINILTVGGIALLMNDYLPTLKEIVEITGTTVIFINQIRDTIGGFGFGDQTHTPGGHQFHHTMSIRIHVARKEWIKIPNYNPLCSGKEEPIGLIMKCRTIKNKTYEPYKECELVLIFERGFIDYADLNDVRKEIMSERRKYFKELYK